MSVLRLIPLKGEAIVVDADEAIVGREANCNVVIPHPSVSRRHALLKRKQDVFFVVDQGSANGTFVDSKRIVDATLKNGSVLRFGSSPFKVEVREELPVESIAEDELVVPPTMLAQPQGFSETVLEGAALGSEDLATPEHGTSAHSKWDEEPTVPASSSAIKPLRGAVVRSEAPRAEGAAAPSSATASVGAPAPNRGPAFWLMIAAGALALLFVGAALGLGVAFMARQMGWL